MAQPIVKYTLNKKGQVPEWIDTGSDSFAGEHAISGNKDGYIPRYESPQETIWLGIATGEADPDGTPDDYVGTISTKSALTTYLKTVGNTFKYKTVTATVQVFKLQQQQDYLPHGIKKITLVDYQHQQLLSIQFLVLEHLQPYQHHK